MTYANNLADKTKPAAYLVKIRYYMPAWEENWITPAVGNPYIDWPFGKPTGVFQTSIPNNNVNVSVNRDDAFRINPETAGNIAFNETYDAVNKRIISSDSNTKPYTFTCEARFATSAVRTFSDPIDNQTDIVEWSPTLISEPSFIRDISSLVNGFNPIQVSQIEISRQDPQIAQAIYDGIFHTGFISLYHAVGDLSDTSNVKLIFEGRIADYNGDEEKFTFAVEDKNTVLDQNMIHPYGDNNYSEFIPVNGYNVDDSESGYEIRKIYGFANNIRGVNVDKPNLDLGEVPDTTNNRKWIFGKYDGDNTRLADQSINCDGVNVLIRCFEEFPFNRPGLGIAWLLDANTATEQDILDAVKALDVMQGDKIKVTFSAYPGKTFYFTAKTVVRQFGDQFYLESGGVTGEQGFSAFPGYGNDAATIGKSCFEQMIYNDDLFDIVANETGDSVAVVKSKIADNIAGPPRLTGTVERGVCSNMLMRTKDGIDVFLKHGIDYNTYKDPVRGVYGLQLIDNAEAIIDGLGYTPLDGSEVVWGRVYGQKPQENNYSAEIEYVNFSSFNFTLYYNGAENNVGTVFYNFFKDYMGLADSDIDLVKMQYITDQFKATIDSTGSQRIFKNNLARFFNFQGLYTAATAFPKNVGELLPDVKQQLIELSKIFNAVAFINNDNKWSVVLPYIDGSVDPAKEFTDKDFELVSGEEYQSTDIMQFRDYKSDYCEYSFFPEIPTQDISTYIFSSNAYKNEQIEFRTYNPIIDPISQKVEFSTIDSNTDKAINAAANYANYKYRACFISIKVDREHFDLDLGDIISIESDVILQRFKSGEACRFMIVAVEQFLDFRVLKLVDYTQVYRSSILVDSNLWDKPGLDRNTYVNT